MASAWVRSWAMLLVACVASGCLTPLTVDRWKGRDRIEGIGFRRSSNGDAIVRWIVDAGLRARKGQLRFDSEAHDCPAFDFFVYGEQGVEPLRRDTWTWAALEPGPIARDVVDLQAARCDVGLVVASVGRDHDPQLWIRRGGRHFSTAEVKPPRRHAMDLVMPFAAIGDLVGAATGFFLLAYLMGPDSWHTWTPTHGVEHHRLPEDEVIGHAPDRGVYP